jgi:hypothetical protein
MDAYATTPAGDRLNLEVVKRPDGSERLQLTDETQRREFAAAAFELSKLVDGIDADFTRGGLGISAPSSAVNHLMYFYGARIDVNTEQYSSGDVKLVSDRIAAGDAAHVPAYVLDDEYAMHHAKAFIKTCAKLGLGIEISP